MITMPSTVGDVIDFLLSFNPRASASQPLRDCIFAPWDPSWEFERLKFRVLHHETGFRCYTIMALFKHEERMCGAIGSLSPLPACTNCASFPPSSCPYTSTVNGGSDHFPKSRGRNLRRYYWVGPGFLFDFAWLTTRRPPGGSVIQGRRRGRIPVARDLRWCGPYKGPVWSTWLMWYPGR